MAKTVQCARRDSMTRTFNGIVRAFQRGTCPRGAALRFAVLLFPLAPIAPHAATLSEGRHGTAVVFNDSLWNGTVVDQNVELKCIAQGCGGDAAECDTMVFDTKPGFTRADFFETFRRDFTSGVADRFDQLGYGPEVVDQPTSFMEAGKIVVLSSVRYDEGGHPTRAWFAQLGAPFGVLVVSCYGDDDKVETAEPAWLAVVKGVDLPKD